MGPGGVSAKELCCKSANCSRILSRTGLSVTNSLVSVSLVPVMLYCGPTLAVRSVSDVGQEPVSGNRSTGGGLGISVGLENVLAFYSCHV